MISRLRDRWFSPQADERIPQERIDEARSFLAHRGTLRLKTWLLDAATRSEPRPGPEHDMLYQCGQRDAFRAVRDYLDKEEVLASQETE